MSQTITIKTQIQEAMKDAMRAKNQARLNAIRLILAAIKQREVDERIELGDEQVLVTLDKMVKQRRESIALYQTAQRMDLVEKEEAELVIIQSYLPTPLSASEIDVLIQSAIQNVGASSIKDMGKVMAILKPECQGRADMTDIGAKIKVLLGNPA